jgi:hypothetical protein
MLLERLKGTSVMKMFWFSFILFLLGVSVVSAQEIPYIEILQAPDDKDITWGTHFRLERALNYTETFWVVRTKDHKIVGYAPWDKIKRRYTLFNLHGENRGFLQATVGQQFLKHRDTDVWYNYYTQYLWYWTDNVYRGVFIITLGGRPKDDNLPNGELGGDMMLYALGNIPIKPPNIFTAIDPARRPMGIDISIVHRLPVTWK